VFWSILNKFQPCDHTLPESKYFDFLEGVSEVLRAIFVDFWSVIMSEFGKFSRVGV
jgi:hypothetical protein